MSVLSCTSYGPSIRMDATGTTLRTWRVPLFFIDRVIENGGGLPHLVGAEREALREAVRFRLEVRAGRLVYFAQRVSGGPIKIGVAKDPDKRLQTLQCACPERLALLAITLGGYVEEAKLHRHFAVDRLEGEWFTPSDELLAHINKFPSIGGPRR